MPVGVDPGRPYRMVARAASVAATGERILDAAVSLFWELPGEQVSLDEVARRAGVTVQTVIRRFGGREGLFAAAAEREVERVRAQRDEAPAGDVAGAVRVLLDHYGRWVTVLCGCLPRRSAFRGCASSPSRGGPTTAAGALASSHSPWRVARASSGAGGSRSS